MSATPEQEGRAVRMMLELGVSPAEVAAWAANAHRRRESTPPQGLGKGPTSPVPKTTTKKGGKQ